MLGIWVVGRDLIIGVVIKFVGWCGFNNLVLKCVGLMRYDFVDILFVIFVLW